MTHIAIQEQVNGKNVDWMEHVTETQYPGCGRAELLADQLRPCGLRRFVERQPLHGHGGELIRANASLCEYISRRSDRAERVRPLLPAGLERRRDLADVVRGGAACRYLAALSARFLPAPAPLGHGRQRSRVLASPAPGP
jgi:hypothetical protein